MRGSLLVLALVLAWSGAVAAQPERCRRAGGMIICNEEASRALADGVCPGEWVKRIATRGGTPWSQEEIEACQLVCRKPEHYGQSHFEVACALLGIMLDERIREAEGVEREKQRFNADKWFCDNQPDEFDLYLDIQKDGAHTLGERCHRVAASTTMGLTKEQRFSFAKKACIVGYSRSCQLARQLDPEASFAAGCKSDQQCKGGRVCREGICVAP